MLYKMRRKRNLTDGSIYKWKACLLTNKIINELKFTQSKYDPCVYWKQGCVIVVYTDDTIITGPNSTIINQIIAEIEQVVNITSKDQVDDFLGVNIEYNTNGKITLSQPKLIQSILDDLGLKEGSVTKAVPALSTKILNAYKESLPFVSKHNRKSKLFRKEHST
jgi:Reverse transcriptase (RNA-dependent DNA polymerase)